MWPFDSWHRFPPLASATPEGLVYVGGELTVDWLLDAYRHGIFPWPLLDGDRAYLTWFSPDPRAIIEFKNFHVSHRLARRLRRGEFTFTIDRDFSGVLQGCAAPRHAGGETWITPALAAGFEALHEVGIAHSLEAWQDGELVGGVYGVALRGYFSAESMFYRRRDASKAALAMLLRHLEQRQFQLVDIQVATAHTRNLGASLLPRNVFCARLQAAQHAATTFGTKLTVAPVPPAG
jgi:leucyl/phenylalanyl-tRNA--protein transferase